MSAHYLALLAALVLVPQIVLRLGIWLFNIPDWCPRCGKVHGKAGH